MTVRLAMTYGSAELTEIDSLIENPNIVLEQKFDGTRCLVVIARTEGSEYPFIRFLGRSGGVLKHTAAMQHFDSIRAALAPHFPRVGETVLDGEIMIDTGNFVVFDLPYMRVEADILVSAETPFFERSQVASALISVMKAPILKASTKVTTQEKRELLEAVIASHGEGVMAKDRMATYGEGKRVKHSLKIKFVKTADVVVTDWCRGTSEKGVATGSASFAVHDNDGNLIPLASCSLIGKPEVKIGDVIEVKYLYRQAGGGLVQPRMVCVREDREPSSCTFDQFEDYSKAVI